MPSLGWAGNPPKCHLPHGETAMRRAADDRRRYISGAMVRAFAIRWHFGLLVGALGLSLAGCILESEGGDDSVGGTGGECGGAQCSVNALCRDGECVCQTGYLGNPYAEFGCQLPGDESPCQTTCGLNAVCEGTACVCIDGFVGCGTGDCIEVTKLCDGVVDCPAGGDEGEFRCTPSIDQTYVLTDGCNDDIDVEYRLWAEQRDWVWPGPDEVFVTPGLGVSVAQAIECIDGELVCVGARAGDLVYGVDLDASLSCEDCCFPCDAGTIDYGVLDCG